jgi:uncharacterized protein YdaT
MAHLLPRYDINYYDMPWHNGDYPPSYKNQPVDLRNKAVEIANELLGRGLDEGVAIATGLKRARIIFSRQSKEKAMTTQAAERKTKTGEE